MPELAKAGFVEGVDPVQADHRGAGEMVPFGLVGGVNTTDLDVDVFTPGDLKSDGQPDRGGLPVGAGLGVEKLNTCRRCRGMRPKIGWY